MEIKMEIEIDFCMQLLEKMKKELEYEKPQEIILNPQQIKMLSNKHIQSTIYITDKGQKIKIINEEFKFKK